MPPAPRTLSLTYGPVTIGTSDDDAILDAGPEGEDRIQITKTKDLVTIRFNALLANVGSDTDFATQVQDLEQAFRQPRQRLEIVQGGETWFLLDPSADSGIQIRSQIEKSGSPHDTGRSRRWTVRITAQQPADQAVVFDGEAGLRDVSYQVSFLPSRLRSMSIQGVYTRLGANLAPAQYLANIGLRVAAIQSSLGGVWEIVDEKYTPSDVEESIVNFSRLYEELAIPQDLSGNLDNPSIYRQRLSVGQSIEAPGDSGLGVERLRQVPVSYESWLDINAVTDYESFYQQTIRPWIIAHAQDTFPASSFALVGEVKRFDRSQGRVNVNMTFLVVGGSSVLSRNVSSQDFDEFGREIVPTWNADPLAAYVFNRFRTYTRTVTVTQRVTGTVNPPAVANANGRALPNALGIFGNGAGLQFGIVGAQDQNQLGALQLGADGLPEAPGGDVLPAGRQFVFKNRRFGSTSLNLGSEPSFPVTDLVQVEEAQLVNVIQGNPGGVVGAATQPGGLGRATPGFGLFQ